MSTTSDYCEHCNRSKNALNKTNWIRHIVACGNSSSAKRNKKQREDRPGNIKSYFSCKKTKKENTITELSSQASTPLSTDFLPINTVTKGKPLRF